MKLSLTEYQYQRIQERIACENILEGMVFKISLITEDGKTEPDMEWDFTDVKKDLDLSKLWVKTKEDAKEYLSILREKIKELPTDLKKKIIRYVMYSFLGLLSLNQIQSSLEPTLQKAVETEKQVLPKVVEQLRIRQSSEDLINHLKWEEGSITRKGEPVLTAYDLGDGAYTIGYGHAIFKGENEGYDFLPKYNKIRPGKTKITKEEAEILLKDDIKIAEGIVNEILNDWEDQGIKPKLTQGMYNTMVSMAYNMGRGIRTKDFIQSIKRGDFKLAKKQIAQTSSGLFKKFPGLQIRRAKEAQMFA
jgi:GH24 family phage-related lysozyme (muramidase)